MISHKHKFIFIHIPKCAGSSIEMFFKVKPFDWKTPNFEHLVGRDPETGIHLQHATVNELKEHNYIPDELWKEYYSFALVRNPWSRAVSDYFWIKKDLKIRGTFEEYLLKEGKFKEFFTNKKNPLYRGDHIIPQKDFVYNDRKLMVNFVGRMEHLHEDFQIICKKINIPFTTLPHEKKGKKKHKHYSHFYTDSQIKMVEDIYADDINLFNYSFDDQRHTIKKGLFGLRF